jgi:hypothetical protein
MSSSFSSRFRGLHRAVSGAFFFSSGFDAIGKPLQNPDAANYN